MSNYVLLNNITHKNLKVVVEHSEKYGDNVMTAITFPEEFRAVQAEYPILFNKDEDTGQFYAAAIFGLREGENLFLNAQGWDANYIPISIKRRPFLIGFQKANIDGVLKNNMVVHVDMDSPRVNETSGESVFLPHGGHSAYLEKMLTMLDYMSITDQTGKDFASALAQHDLLEPLTIDVELKDKSQYKLLGFYTINEDKLKTLSPEVINEFHKKNYLEYIYMVLASTSHIHNLIMRIEARISSVSV